MTTASALGTPVAPHFDLTAAPFPAELALALSSVDAVHGDGTLPQIPVMKNRGGATAGSFTPPADMRIATATREPRLTLLHELGHLLDWDGISYRSDREDSELAQWRAAVEASAPIRQLRSMAKRKTMVAKLSPWRGPEKVRIRQKHVSYLLRPTEIFARSYSQFIAQRSGDVALLTELGGLLGRGSEVLYPEQWKEPDFGQVSQAFEDLFRGRGWMQ